MVVCRASVDDVDDDCGVLDLEVLAALVQLPRADVERPGQPVHRVHVDPELGHGGLREVVNALPRRLFVGKEKSRFSEILSALCLSLPRASVCQM